jgi:hypothetical protein
MSEKWKDIEGYEGLYQISNLGRVKSFKKNNKSYIMKQSNGKYPSVSFYKNGKEKRFLVHRLVAKSFLTNTENKGTVNHINGIKTDNRVENLEWCTQKENIHHALKTGIGSIGERNGLAKFTNEQVRHLRKIYKPYDSKFGGAALARKYGISGNKMHLILTKQTYKNID